MNWKAKLRLVLGLLFVGALSLALIIYVDTRQAALSSKKAQIDAATYTVGTDYTGLVVNQYIQEGQHVVVGQTLFDVKSSSLIEQMRVNGLTPKQLIYPLDEDGNIRITAPRVGTVASIAYAQGSFVPANKEIATIIDDQTVHVTATYLLAKRDFARLNKATRITVSLPNGATINATVDTITVIKQTDTVETEVTAKLPNFSTQNISLTSGTPVDTILHLKEDTWYARIRRRIAITYNAWR
jgi:multidrug resistance efflux pump